MKLISKTELTEFFTELHRGGAIFCALCSSVLKEYRLSVSGTDWQYILHYVIIIEKVKETRRSPLLFRTLSSKDTNV
jgi:hypothetical protein